jgi:tetratricopeptide (TPR) repeat protein
MNVMKEENIVKLKNFCNLLKKSPNLIHNSQLSFFKEFLLDFKFEEEKTINNFENDNFGKNLDSFLKSEKNIEKYLNEMGEDFNYLDNEKNKELVKSLIILGNKYFNEKKFFEAGILYGKSIGLCINESKLFLKRALCLYYLEKFRSSIRDCERSVELNKVESGGFR